MQRLRRQDEARLGAIRWCPTQFQEFVAGQNVRVHVVGEAVFPTRIRSAATDYRYAHREGKEARLEPWTLPEDTERACVRLARTLGLEVAGIDLILASDGRTVCLEANTSPAFSFFEAEAGQPIARAIALHLLGRDAGDATAASASGTAPAAATATAPAVRRAATRRSGR